MALQLLNRLSDRRPNEVAIHEPAQGGEPARDVTHGQLLAAVRSTAARLRSALRPGDVMLLVSPNRAEFTAAFLGGLGAGGKVFPLSPELTEVELLAAEEQVSPVAVVGTAEALATLRGRVPHLLPVDEVCNPQAPSAAFDETGAAG